MLLERGNYKSSTATLPEKKRPQSLFPQGTEKADLFQRREGRWREDLVADVRDDGSIALAVVADLVPGGIILECRPPRLAICKRFPWEYVSQLIAGFPDEGRPEADGTDAVPFPDGKQLVSKAG